MMAAHLGVYMAGGVLTALTRVIPSLRFRKEAMARDQADADDQRAHTLALLEITLKRRDVLVGRAEKELPTIVEEKRGDR